MTAPKRRPKRRTYHHGDLRNALVRATLDLIEEVGPKGVRLTEAARRAGVSSAAPYRHFEDREAMIAAVALEGTELLARSIAECLARPIPFPERVEAVALTYVRFARDHRAHFRAMYGADLDPGRHPELRAAIRATVATLENAIGHEAGRTLPAGLDPARAMSEIWAQAHGVAALLVDGAFTDALAGVDAESLVAGLVHRYMT